MVGLPHRSESSRWQTPEYPAIQHLPRHLLWFHRHTHVHCVHYTINKQLLQRI